MGTDGTTAGAKGARPGEVPDGDEVLRDDELAPPSPEELSRELTDAIEDAVAEERIGPKPTGVDAIAKRLSSHSEI